VRLFIDPGHGGSDPGAVGYGLREKDLTLSIGLRVRDILLAEYNGVEISMSRTTDTFPSLVQRTNMANRWGADYFLSIHINSGGGTGFESFIFTGTGPPTTTYQNAIHEEIMKVIGMVDRGRKRAEYHVLRESNMPAILTESGFIDSPADTAKMKSPAWIEAVARGHVNGIARAFGLQRKVNVSEIPPAPTPAPAPAPTPIQEEEDIMAQPFQPSVQAIRDSVNIVLRRFEQKDPALAATWRQRYNNGELTISDAVGLLYVAIERGYIQGTGTTGTTGATTGATETGTEE
jgi:N-acetylmuramoyl-L-alanine amidase